MIGLRSSLNNELEYYPLDQIDIYINGVLSERFKANIEERKVDIQVEEVQGQIYENHMINFILNKHVNFTDTVGLIHVYIYDKNSTLMDISSLDQVVTVQAGDVISVKYKTLIRYYAHNFKVREDRFDQKTIQWCRHILEKKAWDEIGILSDYLKEKRGENLDEVTRHLDFFDYHKGENKEKCFVLRKIANDNFVSR
jgi:hypothetical protein